MPNRLLKMLLSGKLNKILKILPNISNLLPRRFSTFIDQSLWHSLPILDFLYSSKNVCEIHTMKLKIVPTAALQRQRLTNEFHLRIVALKCLFHYSLEQLQFKTHILMARSYTSCLAESGGRLIGTVVLTYSALNQLLSLKKPSQQVREIMEAFVIIYWTQIID